MSVGVRDIAKVAEIAVQGITEHLNCLDAKCAWLAVHQGRNGLNRELNPSPFYDQSLELRWFVDITLDSEPLSQIPLE